MPKLHNPNQITQYNKITLQTTIIKNLTIIKITIIIKWKQGSLKCESKVI